MTSVLRTSTDQFSLAGPHAHSDRRVIQRPRRTNPAYSENRRSVAVYADHKPISTSPNFAYKKQTSTTLPLRAVTSSDSIPTHGLSESSLDRRPSVSRSTTNPDAPVSPRSLTAMGDLRPQIPMPSIASVERSNSKMHQTSSKILRMTDDDRPFTKDFKDLFSTLITSLPLNAHRVRFSKVEETFLSEEAIVNLGSLKFSQSNRIPDPKNPSRWVVTTTTTTFSMAKEMARSVCQRFVDARLIESAEQKVYSSFPSKGAVWQLTPKGTAVLKRFCDRNGIDAQHIEPLVRRPQMQMVDLERDPDTDKLIQDKTTIEVIFRRFAGQEGPNLKSTTSLSDSDSVSEYWSGLVGVKMARDRRLHDKTFHNTFTGKAASDWLLDCCTTIDRRETYEICELFVKWRLMAPVVEDRAFVRYNPLASHFQPTKHAIYMITDRGQRVCGWVNRASSTSSDDSGDGKERVRMPRDTNMNRLNAILNDAALRMLFKEHLKASLCEENLNFYIDAQEFIASYKYLERSRRLEMPEAVRETLATAYGLYNSFLASGAPSELNIDHSLRNKLDNRMTQTDADDASMRTTLKHVVDLIELASNSVFKLMASDSVPKFIRDPRYQQLPREHELGSNGQSRTRSPAPAMLDMIARTNTLRRQD